MTKGTQKHWKMGFSIQLDETWCLSLLPNSKGPRCQDMERSWGRGLVDGTIWGPGAGTGAGDPSITTWPLSPPRVVPSGPAEWI